MNEPVDRDELEQHLRDRVDARVAAPQSARADETIRPPEGGVMVVFDETEDAPYVYTRWKGKTYRVQMTEV